MDRFADRCFSHHESRALNLLDRVTSKVWFTHVRASCTYQIRWLLCILVLTKVSQSLNGLYSGSALYQHYISLEFICTVKIIKIRPVSTHNSSQLTFC
jgi:hypothetical protein